MSRAKPTLTEIAYDLLNMWNNVSRHYMAKCVSSVSASEYRSAEEELRRKRIEIEALILQASYEALPVCCADCVYGKIIDHSGMTCYVECRHNSGDIEKRFYPLDFYCAFATRKGTENNDRL